MEKDKETKESGGGKAGFLKPLYVSEEQTLAIINFHERCVKHEKGRMADLRRTGSVEEVFANSLFYEFSRKLDEAGSNPFRKPGDAGKAILLGCLSRVQERTFENLFNKLGGHGEGEKPLLSPARFNRLMRTRTREEFYRNLFRVLALLKKSANLEHLSDFVFQKAELLENPALVEPNYRDSFYFRWSGRYYGSN